MKTEVFCISHIKKNYFSFLILAENRMGSSNFVFRCFLLSTNRLRSTNILIYFILCQKKDDIALFFILPFVKKYSQIDKNIILLSLPFVKTIDSRSTNNGLGSEKELVSAQIEFRAPRFSTKLVSIDFIAPIFFPKMFSDRLS